MTLFFSAALAFGNFSSDHTLMSGYAVDTHTGQVLLNESSEKSLVPSSCIKVITTAAALQILDPEMRFQTDLQYDGVIDDKGTLDGNLYIRGGGDPCLGSDRFGGWEKQLDLWVEAIQKQGIKKIRGEVIGDATRWEKALAAPSWLWEDLGNYYGAGACALTFHENLYTLTFKPGKEGDPAPLIRMEPEIPGLTIENELITGPVGSGDQAWIYGSEYSSVQYIRGTIPAGVEEFSIKGAVPDPAKLCSHLLTKALLAKGIAVEHQKRDFTNRIRFHTTQSPMLKEVVYWTNQKSINLYAEHLLKKMGEVVFKEGSTKAGVKAITQFWKDKKIDLEGFNLADGSGLSRKNLVTAQQFVAMLSQIKKTDVFPIFLDSLPQQTDRVRAKSGGQSFIRGYVGYADEMVFAILVNASFDPQVSQKIKALLTDLSQPAARAN